MNDDVPWRGREDQTLHAFACDKSCHRYDYKLCLYVGVDSENKTQVFAQGFFSNESTEAFDFANKFFLEICGGHPTCKVGVVASVCDVLVVKRILILETNMMHQAFKTDKRARRSKRTRTFYG